MPTSSKYPTVSPFDCVSHRPEEWWHIRGKHHVCLCSQPGSVLRQWSLFHDLLSTPRSTCCLQYCSPSAYCTLDQVRRELSPRHRHSSNLLLIVMPISYFTACRRGSIVGSFGYTGLVTGRANLFLCHFPQARTSTHA